ncbi:acetyltransferase [Trypanosoma cruzi]|uniref:Phospholipid/glycerol acyltransferase domain-containing protein n=2 Tax=Trypanosoma cruzi TaxID=5693 RepID=V5BF39_TRYCR|nr:hypothetical protein TCDM_09239 [Trypanosoma cruzi Dm28c]PBJ71495.1 hypothetical protein BCY84_16840 [Trypanosoma cruzi cruzi]PWU94711.1 hypothetical protein C4B63_25g184 [Trypanosoma cruzi]RNF15486.1 acetyltransferase [Trypanosoma cruzi]
MASVKASGLFFAVALTVASVSAFFFTIWPAAVLVLVRLTAGFIPTNFMRLCTAWYDGVQEKWLAFVVIFLECVLKLRLAYTIVSTSATTPSGIADVFAPPQPGNFKLIILNHRSRIDWLMMFPFLARANVLRTLRIVLKAGLSRIPVFGWSMQLFRYIFLSRKWSSDEAKMNDVIVHYRENGGATILLFPEGTDLSESNVEKSHAYAAQNGLPRFHHVLNPRVKGFVAMKNMIGAANIEEIVDVTMGYTDFVPGERPAECSVVNGRMPKKVHILCMRHRMAENTPSMGEERRALDVVPTDDDGLSLWLNDCFAKKEVLLSQFYASNPVGFEPHHVLSVFGENCTVFTYDEDEEMALHPNSTKFSLFVRDVGIWRGFVAIIVLWTIPVLYWVFCGGLLSLLLYGLLAAMCVWINREKGGLDVWLFLQPQPKRPARKEELKTHKKE